MNGILDAIEKRRSRYDLNGEASISDAELSQILKAILLHMPTAYNMQSTRLVLLLGAAHKKLWEEIVLGKLKGLTSPERFPKTQVKIGTFAAAHGTVLFFDDSAVTERFKAENPAYAQNFDPWALQQNGMLQYAVWATLAEKGMGASLQHYNPIIDDDVKAAWGLPKEWMLLAQMPFGKTTGQAGEKEKLPIEERFFEYGG